MAVGTQEHTFPRLLAQRPQCQRNPFRIDFQALFGRIEMMERQRSQAPGVATDTALPAGLLDQSLLHLAATLGDGTHPALLAPVIPSPFQQELALPVVS